MNKLERRNQGLARQGSRAIRVYIQPCNENQELNYMENFTGTPAEIVTYSLDMIAGLKKTLKQGTFSVKIESVNFADGIYIDEQNVYDRDFEIIAPVSLAESYL